MRILIVEDDVLFGNSLKLNLESELFSVDLITDGNRGSYAARTTDYDLLILDHMLPNKQGHDICKEVRGHGKTMPILMLSAKHDAKQKIETLNVGADDYLTKPFSYNELIARLRALLRRPKEIARTILAIDTLELDTERHTVSRNNDRIYLTNKEYALLEFLLRNERNVVSRGMLLEHVWDMNCDPFSNTIEVHVRNLRKKIERPGELKLIHNIPGRGYKIDMQP